MRIGIDAMGGDNAPGVEVRGALMSREALAPEDRIVLVGDEAVLREHLDDEQGWEEFIEIRHASEIIGMNETPVEALRAKPDSSMAVLFAMHRAGELDAGISAGNTGACVAAAQMQLRRLSGVHRPGIAILAPTFHGPVALCDVGANVSCRPVHLQQYGVMASVYLSTVAGIDDPRVGLLSVGEEEAKGNDLVRQTRELLKADPNVNFVGNVEGRDLFRGVCDVMVCEGFVGNVAIKLMEGMAEGVLKSILREVATALPAHAEMVQRAGGAVVAKYDFNEYGGAPLLGIGGICIICHGASAPRGIKNAVRVAVDVHKRHVNERITELLSQSERTVHG